MVQAAESLARKKGLLKKICERQYKICLLKNFIYNKDTIYMDEDLGILRGIKF